MASPRLLRGRSSERGAYYAITTITRDRQTLFREGRCANAVIGEIERCDAERRVESIAWVVMPDHIHWLFRLERESLSQTLQAFKSRSARLVNVAIDASMNLWQPGYYDHRLRNDEDLVAQARYIVANPLRRGLANRIEDYPFWWCRYPLRTDEL